MAKKKKAEEEEDVFVPPEFNEREYIEKDLRDSKILIMTTIWGLVAGLSAAAATIFVNNSPLVFLDIICVFRCHDFCHIECYQADMVFKGGRGEVPERCTNAIA